MEPQDIRESLWIMELNADFKKYVEQCGCWISQRDCVTAEIRRRYMMVMYEAVVTIRLLFQRDPVTKVQGDAWHVYSHRWDPVAEDISIAFFELHNFKLNPIIEGLLPLMVPKSVERVGNATQIAYTVEFETQQREKKEELLIWGSGGILYMIPRIYAEVGHWAKYLKELEIADPKWTPEEIIAEIHRSDYSVRRLGH